MVHFEKINFSGSELFGHLGEKKAKTTQNMVQWDPGAVQIGEYSLQDNTARNAYKIRQNIFIVD